jgi:hypothetical protein
MTTTTNGLPYVDSPKPPGEMYCSSSAKCFRCAYMFTVLGWGDPDVVAKKSGCPECGCSTLAIIEQSQWPDAEAAK